MSLISKHRYEAKELWLQRQEKLKKGIIDEETQSVMETCLSTKRQPERNTKNLTYFIKDDTYDNRDFLESKTDFGDEDLSLNDLQYERELETKTKPEKKATKKLEESQQKIEKVEEEEEKVEEEDDFLKKVNQSLKDARDLMSKIERYPSILKSKNPEKALKVMNNLDKENKQHTPTLPKSKAQKPVKAVTSNNLKNSLGSSVSSQKQLAASSGNKNRNSIQSPKAEVIQKKVLEEEPEQLIEDNDNQEDISHYFKSLNQIEDTIKFLENNIIGIGNDESKNSKKEEDSTRETLNPINLDALLQKKPEKIEQHESPIKEDNKKEYFDFKMTSPDSLLNKFNENFEFTDQKEKSTEKKV